MFGRETLRVVLGTAQGVDVQVGGHRVVERDLDDLGVDTAQPQPLPQHQRVAAVAVGAHHVGQHEPDADCGFAHGSRLFSWRNAV